MIRCGHNRRFIDAALLAVRRLAPTDALRPHAPARASAPPNPRSILPLPLLTSSAAIGRSIDWPGTQAFGAGTLRYYSSDSAPDHHSETPTPHSGKPTPHSEKPTPPSPPEEGRKKRRGRGKGGRTPNGPSPIYREPQQRPAMYGPTLNFPGTSSQKW